MSFTQQVILLICLVLITGFLSISEISLAGARKIKLKTMADNGVKAALKVLTLKEHPGDFFAASQVGLNAMSILGGILGEAAFSDYFSQVIGLFYQGEYLRHISFTTSFIVVTSLFILFADLIPKRIAMMAPEAIACKIIGAVNLLVIICKPISGIYNAIANTIFRVFNVKPHNNDDITFEDISAIVNAGTDAGILQKQEQHLIENVFELESRTLPSSMTLRENIVYFSLDDDEKAIRQKIAEAPHSKYLICDKVIDRVVGYIDSKDIMLRILKNEPLKKITEITLRKTLMVPDTLTLSEILDQFKATRQDFAVVINEYALVMGIITIEDVMSTVMGNFVTPEEAEIQIVSRDDHSWLIDGATSIEDVKRALHLPHLPDEENYETIAGFIMYSLRRIPKQTDTVEYANFKFEVVDIDNYKIDQLLVTKI